MSDRRAWLAEWCPECRAAPGRRCRRRARSTDPRPATRLHVPRGWRARPCPTCGVTAGDACRTPSGREASQPHVARLRAGRRELVWREDVWKEARRAERVAGDRRASSAAPFARPRRAHWFRVQRGGRSGLAAAVNKTGNGGPVAGQHGAWRLLRRGRWRSSSLSPTRGMTTREAGWRWAQNQRLRRAIMRYTARREARHGRNRRKDLQASRAHARTRAAGREHRQRASLAGGCADVCGVSACAARSATRLGRLGTRSQSEDLLVGPVQEVSERRSDGHPDGKS